MPGAAPPPPAAILFDWHGTLVNTLDAMYLAIEDMLPRLEELGLFERLVEESAARSPDDEKLIRYLRIFRRLHPGVLAERRISRTEIFDCLFGDDHGARGIAHHAYNDCYRKRYGAVTPFQEGIYDYLQCLAGAGIPLGVATNRSREFFDNELAGVDDGRWAPLLQVTRCGDESAAYKPEPDCLLEACAALDVDEVARVWYVGDSPTDMLTARRAGLTAVFYNSALLSEPELDRLLAGDGTQPDARVDDFEQLLDLVALVGDHSGIAGGRPPRRPPRSRPAPRVEPDWHPAVASLSAPRVILFDWHATLVDTLDAMYRAVDDLLPELEQLGLLTRLVPPESSRSPEDQRLVTYVRGQRRLHPKIKADRKISRTDIFEILFGEDEGAKRIAHEAFKRHYRNYFGKALPFEPRVPDVLRGLCDIGIPLGVITNRDREFFVHELANVDGEDWSGFFRLAVCGDDTERRKPHPDQLLRAAAELDIPLGSPVWYVGDSSTDTVAAGRAGVTSVFFNGAQWDQPWLNRVFPRSERFPHAPDVVVNDFADLWALVLACRRRAATGTQ